MFFFLVFFGGFYLSNFLFICFLLLSYACENKILVETAILVTLSCSCVMDGPTLSLEKKFVNSCMKVVLGTAAR